MAPGQAAVEHFEPTGAPRVHPIRMYLVVNILFFFFAPWINLVEPGVRLSAWAVDHTVSVALVPGLATAIDASAERAGIDAALYRRILDSRMQAQQGALLWVLIPVVAAASFAVTRRRRRYPVEHLVWATTMVSFFFLSMLLATAVSRIVLAVVPREGDWIQIVGIPLLVWLVWLVWTGYRSTRRFFEIGWFRSWLTLVWLGSAGIVGTLLYLVLLCALSLFGLRGLQAPSG
ncbi:MAG: hypothetical protein AAGE94_13840 [Acidobacteriota bacterium]